MKIQEFRGNSKCEILATFHFCGFGIVPSRKIAKRAARKSAK
jgi:hypothetical protein